MNTLLLVEPPSRRSRAGRQVRCAFVTLLLCLVLAACGGGAPNDGSDVAPVSTKEVASGTVTGFGSVIVDGTRYEDGGATVVVDVDPTAAQPVDGAVAAAAVGLGMQVEVDATDGSAETITVSAALIGRIQRIDASGFVAAAQTVVVSTDPAAPTYFEGAAGLDDLAVGDLVEVHGNRDPGGALVATRVDVKDPRSAPIVRVVGQVTGLDAAGGTFTIGGLLVAYDDSTRIVPAGVTLADGQVVVVFSRGAVVGDRLDAQAIRITRRQVEAGTQMRVAGLIRGLDFRTLVFSLDGFTIDAATATFSGGTSADLANGRRVRVVGRFEDGRVLAREVRFGRVQQGIHDTTLTGPITDHVSPGSFRIRGVPIDASASDVVFEGGTAGNLGDGVVVRVEGDIDGNIVRAARVVFVNTPDGRVRNFVGIVSDYVSSTGAFRIGVTAMRLTSDTTFRHADTTPARVEDFGNDDRVQVRGQWTDGVFVVADVIFRPGASVVVARTSGTAYSVDAAAGAFVVNGVVVVTDGATAFVGASENLRTGVTVDVEGRFEAGRLVAIRVEVRAVDETVP